MVSTHSVLRLQMAEHRLDRGASSQFALDLLCHIALLAGGVDPHACPRRGVVAAIAGAGEHAGERDADLLGYGGNDAGERVAIIRMARQRGDVGH